MAEGSGAVWTMQVNGNHDDGRPFITAMFTYAGGVGARAAKPGLSACSYPTGVAAVPVEVVEASAPIRFHRKELRPDSGGAGAQPGGLGQTIEFSVDTTRPWQLNAVTSRLAVAPEGIFGGGPGAAGRFSVNDEPVTTQARVTLQPDDVVRLELPGGGGYGEPVESLLEGAGWRACHDRAERRPAGVVRRLHARRVEDALTLPPVDLHLGGVPGLRTPGAVRPRVAVRRTGQPDPRTRRLLHRHGQRRGRHRRPGQGRRRSTPSRRSAGTAGMEVAEGDGQLHDVHLPVPPLDLRPRRPPARRAGDGAHRTASTRRTGACPALAVEVWQGFVFVNLDPTPRRSAPPSPATSRSSSTTTSSDCVCPGTFTLTDLPWNWKVMFENFNDGYHANRLHQVIQDFCPSSLAAFPVPWDDGSNVVFRTNGYTHIDGGFNATTKALLPVFPDLTEEERWRSTFALDAADAVPRHRARPGLLLHRDARRRPTRSTSRSATCSTRARSSTRCSTTCSR